MSNDQKKIVSASAAEPLGAELERLLQPTRHFQHPRDVVRDAILTTAEKRAILSSWASDACRRIDACAAADPRFRSHRQV